MPRHLKILLVVLVGLIIVAHVGMWRDPDMPYVEKRNWTLINALAWAAIILPAIGVSQWLKVKTSNTDEPSP